MRFLLGRLSTCRFLSRRFNSNESSITSNDSNSSKELEKTKTNETSKDLVQLKRAFTLLKPETMHTIKRVDDTPMNNELDYIRFRLNENRRFEFTFH